MARRYTDEDVAQWYARYQEGLTLKEVAREFGVAEPTVQGAFLRRRLPRRAAIRRTVTPKPRPGRAPLPSKRPPQVPQREWKVLLARQNGKSLAEIGRELGVTRQRVAQIEQRALRLMPKPRPRKTALVASAVATPEVTSAAAPEQPD